MSKKNKISIVVVLVMSVFFYLYMNQTKKVIDPLDDHQKLGTHNLINDNNSTILENKNTTSDQVNIVSQLNQTELKANERIELITKLDLKNATDQEINEITDFINSTNPYAQQIQGADPHSMITLNYDKEVALRIYAIKRLSENLSNEAFKKVVTNIEKNAQDESLKRVGRLALEAKLKGESYFENLKKAIENQELP